MQRALGSPRNPRDYITRNSSPTKGPPRSLHTILHDADDIRPTPNSVSAGAMPYETVILSRCAEPRIFPEVSSTLMNFWAPALTEPTRQENKMSAAGNDFDVKRACFRNALRRLSTGQRLPMNLIYNGCASGRPSALKEARASQNPKYPKAELG